MDTRVLQVISKSIGDVYLKKAEFNREPLFAKFRLREPLKRPILSAEPSISVHQLESHDQFVIFASDGLWEHLSNQEAVDIVQKHPHSGSARRLVKAALQEAAKKREMRFSDLKKIDRGVRRHFHDDITVVVVFLDSNLVSRAGSVKIPNVSVKGGGINLPSNTLVPCITPT
ncbi:protein phosphatase 2C family protein [Actinidia rufa]|uniref:Protein phosphatase 2C family protein n=1 Tax=Actinidia rufa TaxID=165716 RepID=A0A7J0FP71_9ERIC|nr:protein phosphatase 2C family protein [Actinidia rufa]